MKIENPEPLLQHLEKTSVALGVFTGWHIAGRLTLMVEHQHHEKYEYILQIVCGPDVNYQELNREAALHWLREAE